MACFTRGKKSRAEAISDVVRWAMEEMQRECGDDEEVELDITYYGGSGEIKFEKVKSE